MREIVHLQAGQCGNQIGAKVRVYSFILTLINDLQPRLTLAGSSFFFTYLESRRVLEGAHVVCWLERFCKTRNSDKEFSQRSINTSIYD